MVIFFVTLALLAPVLPIDDPTATSWSAVRKAPSLAHLMGTDEIGRDIFSRMICGARASLIAGVISVVLAVALGVPFGLIAGYFGGWLAQIIPPVTDPTLPTPSLILSLALASSPAPTLTNPQ